MKGTADTQDIEFEGCRVTIVADPVYETRDLKPGDMYVGFGRPGPSLLTCRFVTWEYVPTPRDGALAFESVPQQGWVNPTGPGYSHDLSACHKVIAIDGEEVDQ